MKNTPYDSYDKIFYALLNDGYSETEAEQIICDVIDDQIEFTNFAERIHSIIEEVKKYAMN